jgi:hypothetical protein
MFSHRCQISAFNIFSSLTRRPSSFSIVKWKCNEEVGPMKAVMLLHTLLAFEESWWNPGQQTGISLSFQFPHSKSSSTKEQKHVAIENARSLRIFYFLLLHVCYRMISLRSDSSDCKVAGEQLGLIGTCSCASAYLLLKIRGYPEL